MQVFRVKPVWKGLLKTLLQPLIEFILSQELNQAGQVVGYKVGILPGIAFDKARAKEHRMPVRSEIFLPAPIALLHPHITLFGIEYIFIVEGPFCKGLVV